MGDAAENLCSLPDDVDWDGDLLGRHTGVVVAGLIAEAGLEQVIAGSGDNACLNDEFASVYAELGGGIEWQRELRTGRVSGVFEADARGGGEDERGWDQFIVAGGVRVDVQAGGDAEVEIYDGELGGRDGDLFWIKVGDGGGFEDGVQCILRDRKSGSA